MRVCSLISTELDINVMIMPLALAVCFMLLNITVAVVSHVFHKVFNGNKYGNTDVIIGQLRHDGGR